MRLEGTYTAMVTPFKGEMVDLIGLAKNIQFQLEKGIKGIVVLGTTGEAATLSDEEKELVIKTAVREVKGRVPVIVGAGSYSTEKTIENVVKAKALGADAVLVVTPFYNKPTQEGLYQHYKALVTRVAFPVILYNVPGRTSVNLEPATVARIAALPHIIGIKEASGNLSQIEEVMDLVARCNPHFSLLSGDDRLVLPLIALGAHGVISVVSNLVPDQVCKLVQTALAEDFVKARELHFSLLPLFKSAFIETNPIPIKAMMDLAGMPAGPCRLPLTGLKAENQAMLEELLCVKSQ